MPHQHLNFKGGKLPAIAARLLGKAEEHVVSYAQDQVDNLLGEFEDKCPPPPVLERVRKLLDNLEALNLSYKEKVVQVENMVKKLDKPIKAGKVVIDILTHLLVIKKLAFGTPPGPQGGLIFADNTSKIMNQSRRLEKAVDTIEKLEEDKEAINALVSDSKTIFDPVESKVSLLRRLLEACIADPNLNIDDKDFVLGDANKKQDSTEDYRSKNGRVYTITVEQVLDESDVAPKRRAIAKDFRGIVVMIGPSSFASDTEVLKKEIKFRIDNQLP